MDCRAQDKTDDLHITRATAARWQMVYQFLWEGIFIWRWEAQMKGARGSGVRANTQSPTFTVTLSLVEQTLSLSCYNVCTHGMCLWAGSRLRPRGCIRHLALLLDVCLFFFFSKPVSCKISDWIKCKKQLVHYQHKPCMNLSFVSAHKR